MGKRMVSRKHVSEKTTGEGPPLIRIDSMNISVAGFRAIDIRQ